LNAHLLTAQSGYRGAGINGYIFHLLQALPEADSSLTYTVFVGPQGDPPEHARMAARRAPFRTVHPLRRILWEQIVQPAALLKTRPDLHHALAFVSPVFSRVPTVTTVYDLSFIHYPHLLSSARRWYLNLLTKRTCQHARRVIAISKSTADDVAATFGIAPEKIDIAVPGVSSLFQPLPSAEVDRFRWQKELPERFLLFVGTLEPRKNLPVLLRAYAQLPASIRAAVHLVLAGGRGWMFQDIFRAISEYELSDTVHLPGYVPIDELPLWYNAAEAFVFPSVYEGFGLPVIEAMACGTPVLVSDVSSLPEAAGDAGYRLPPHDVNAWTEALDHVIRDPGWRAEASSHGKTRAAMFTWANTAAQTVISYHRALDRTQEISHG
jgi:glycosyltransferase involved in cell wall biosynthesis